MQFYPCKGHIFCYWTRYVSPEQTCFLRVHRLPRPAQPTNHLDIEVGSPDLRLWGIGYELIIFPRPSRLLGFGCADERAEDMERRCYPNLSRREIYHVCCQRGTLALAYLAVVFVSRRFSYGCVQTGRWTSSEATCRLTRYVPEASHIVPLTNLDIGRA